MIDYRDVPLGREPLDVPLCDLIRRIADRDSDAFSSLYLRLTKDVSVVTQSILHNPSLSQDATQNTFIKVWIHAKAFRGTIRLDVGARAWVLSIARNEALNIARKVRREIPCWEISSNSDHMNSREIEFLHSRFEVYRLLDQLTDEESSAIILHCLGDFSILECARMLNLSPATVKRRIESGKRTLRILLMQKNIGYKEEVTPLEEVDNVEMVE